MRDDITLFFPGDGCRENSNTATYKGIKEFKVNPDNTVTFKTLKHGVITTPLMWRLKKGVEGDVPEHDEAPIAGNQARRNARY